MANRGVNKVILVGHLGQDPEIRYMPNGGAVANFSLATSESWRDKQTGETKEKTEWHRVALFGKTAEVAGEYLRKGSQVYIEGTLQTKKWTDQSGAEKYMTEVVVSIGGTMQMLGNRNQSNNSWGQPQPLQQPPTAQKDNHTPFNSNTPSRAKQSSSPTNNEPPIDFDDDIPF